MVYAKDILRDKDMRKVFKKGADGGLMDKIDKERLRFITFCSAPQSLRGGGNVTRMPKHAWT